VAIGQIREVVETRVLMETRLIPVLQSGKCAARRFHPESFPLAPRRSAWYSAESMDD
jgi:hypothetical protein